MSIAKRLTSPVILAHILVQPTAKCNIFCLLKEFFYEVSRTTYVFYLPRAATL